MRGATLDDIAYAADKAEMRHGKISSDDHRCLAVLAEEFGEVAKEVVERRPEFIAAELLDLLGYGLLWLERIRGRK